MALVVNPPCVSKATPKSKSRGQKVAAAIQPRFSLHPLSDWSGVGLKLRCDMASVSHAGTSGVFVDALRGAASVNRQNVVRAIGLTLAAASLAACAQSSVVSRNSAFVP